MITIIETPTFLADIKRCALTDEEHRALINHLAAYPLAGDVMQGTGGVRKLRIAGQGRGKSGAFRVVYYYHDQSMPLFALAMFAKNERANLSQAERNQLKRLVSQLVQAYKEKKRG